MNWSGYDHDAERWDKLTAEAQQYELVGQRCALLDAFDVNKKMPVENQGAWPSCGGHAGSTLLEYIQWLTRGVIQPLSRMFCWVEAQRVHGRPSSRSGVTIHGVVKVLKQIGLPDESLAPYRVGDWYDDFDREVFENAKPRCAEYSYQLKTVEQVWDFHNSGMGGVIWGVPWDFQRGAWHAITSYGPADKFLHGDNSWGEHWDDRDDEDGVKDGRFTWSESKVDRYLETPGVVCFGVSDLSEPQVREDHNYRDEVGV